MWTGDKPWNTVWHCVGIIRTVCQFMIIKSKSAKFQCSKKWKKKTVFLSAVAVNSQRGAGSWCWLIYWQQEAQQRMNAEEPGWGWEAGFKVRYLSITDFFYHPNTSAIYQSQLRKWWLWKSHTRVTMSCVHISLHCQTSCDTALIWCWMKSFTVCSLNNGPCCCLTFGRKSSFSIWIIHQRFDPLLKCHHNNTSNLAAASVFLQLRRIRNWQ